jgi:ubiquitin fusion degradation protein 1
VFSKKTAAVKYQAISMWGFGSQGHGNGAMGGGGMMGRMEQPRVFEDQFHCFSMACADKAHLEGGDKIILPPSVLDSLARMNVEYPMLFKVTSPDGASSHCGVLEFSAPEGSAYLPFWMMQNLFISEGALLTVRNVSLPKATMVKLQPQHVDFLEISNPRAVLEHALRKYSCVTKGDVICIPYNNKNYHFALKEVQPQDAACIIETDVDLDFDAPLGYVEPDYKKNVATNNSGRNSSSSSVDGKPAALSGFENVSRQSRFGGVSKETNGDSTTSSSESDSAAKTAQSSGGSKIVNGEIVKGEDNGENSILDSKLMAEKTGATGVQRNSALPPRAPVVQYWAVAGGGARLDGKSPSPLKDKDGKDVDIREVRAAAAAKRAEEARIAVNAPQEAAVKRKSKVGNKYSKTKASAGIAFEGGGNKM